jgi:hypothetical protein
MLWLFEFTGSYTQTEFLSRRRKRNSGKGWSGIRRGGLQEGERATTWRGEPRRKNNLGQDEQDLQDKILHGILFILFILSILFPKRCFNTAP